MSMDYCSFEESFSFSFGDLIGFEFDLKETPSVFRPELPYILRTFQFLHSILKR